MGRPRDTHRSTLEPEENGSAPSPQQVSVSLEEEKRTENRDAPPVLLKA